MTKVDPARHMTDVRALWTFGEAGTDILNAHTWSDVQYMADEETMSVTISWSRDARLTVDPVTVLASLATGIDTARKYNDKGMYERPWNHVELTHMVREGDRYVTTFAIVPDSNDE